MTLPLGAVKKGNHEFGFGVRKGAGFEVDGFAIVEAADAAAVTFTPAEFKWAPQILPGPVAHSRLLKYADAPQHYGIAWSYDVFQVREVLNSELDRFFRRYVQDHVSTVLRGDGQGHFTNVFMRPIALAPGSSKIIYGIVAAGTPEEVAAELKQISLPPFELERRYEARRAGVVPLASVPAGEPYRFSQQRMAAVVADQRGLSRSIPSGATYGTTRRANGGTAFTPGIRGLPASGWRNWTSNRAIDCLNAYTTKPGDPEAAFIHHGTPLPTQHYLFLELWNLTQSRALLEYFYPRLRQYHLFLAGRLGSSTTRSFKSGLLKTWRLLLQHRLGRLPAAGLHAQREAGAAHRDRDH